jgi:hypothetical protein
MENKQQGRTLRVLIIEQQQEAAKALILDIGANAAIDKAVTPTVLACIHQNLEILQFCLENGGDANANYEPLRNSACSLLSFAARIGNTELVALLLQYGANANYKNALGKSVLEELLHANREDKKEILKLLLKAGADPNTAMTFNGGQSFYEAIVAWNSGLQQVVDDYNNLKK